jgi:transposase
LSIHETAFTNGELYTVLTNKAARGKKGCLVALIKGTKSDNVIEVLKKIPQKQREKVTEVSLDMAASMGKIVRASMTKAKKVIDRFHVQKLAYEAVQEIRIKKRWLAIDEENELIENAKKEGVKVEIPEYRNGDSPKQLLARSRYLLFKCESKWTNKQSMRAKILFEQYPEIKEAYLLAQKLSWVYESSENKVIARTRLANWVEIVRQSGFKSFNTISNTINNHYPNILNYFDNRSTNASAESFNAKIKAFRAQFRGVRDMEFFLFRLTSLYA